MTELVAQRAIDLLGGDWSGEVEVEARSEDALADPVLIAPRQHDADARTLGDPSAPVARLRATGGEGVARRRSPPAENPFSFPMARGLQSRCS